MSCYYRVRYALYGLAVPKDPNDALLRSVRSADLSGVVSAIRDGADPNYDRSKPLRIAVQSGNLELVDVLVGQGADPNAEQSTPYRLAVRVKAYPIMERLERGGADIHAAQERALQLALIDKDSRMTRYLIERGAKACVALNKLEDTSTPDYESGVRRVQQVLAEMLEDITNMPLEQKREPRSKPRDYTKRPLDPLEKQAMRPIMRPAAEAEPVQDGPGL